MNMGEAKVLKVGMIGAGSWAWQHLNAWKICENTEEQRWVPLSSIRQQEQG